VTQTQTHWGREPIETLARLGMYGNRVYVYIYYPVYIAVLCTYLPREVGNLYP